MVIEEEKTDPVEKTSAENDDQEALLGRGQDLKKS
jgi:hypothetical protein